MRLASNSLTRHPRVRSARRGSIWPLLLAILGVLLAGIALAVDASLLWQARQELQVAVDASSLAAVQQLADDRMLLKHSSITMDNVEHARQLAADYAARHHVLSRPLKLEVHDPNHSDVIFGFFDATSQLVQPATPSDWDSPFLNAVEVTGRRTRERGNSPGLFFARLFKLPAADVTASATAVLDRLVVGFRPVGNLTAPLMPIALMSDPAGIEDESWEAQIDKPLAGGGGGQDQYAFDRVARRWTQASDGTTGDGLPEFILKLPLGASGGANGQVIYLGQPSLRNWLRQVSEGVHASDLTTLGGQLTLGWDGLCPVTQGALPGSSGLKEFIEKLSDLQASGEPRAWPLYGPTSTPDGTVMLRGFVAARIADVQRSEDGAQLIIVLQATTLVTGTAVTQPAAEINPYLAKARLLR